MSAQSLIAPLGEVKLELNYKAIFFFMVFLTLRDVNGSLSSSLCNDLKDHIFGCKSENRHLAAFKCHWAKY